MILENLKGKRVILASKSPRRQELLKGLELDFEIRTKDIDEDYSDDLKNEEVPRFLSELKANAFKSELLKNEILITSDTTVHLNGEILEKPKSREQAIQMITKMRGKTHTVITAVTICSLEKTITFHDTTDVTFTVLSDSEISYYIDNYKPYDKAGSYGVQELIGYIGIENMNGSYYNVMGLPLQKLYMELKKF